MFAIYNMIVFGSSFIWKVVVVFNDNWIFFEPKGGSTVI